MKKSKKLMILGLSAATAAVAATGAVSSFAWFATNATVTATGMKIKADTNQYLEISHVTAADTAYTPDWKNTIATGHAEKTLKPVSVGKISTTTTANDTFTASNTWKGHQWASTSSSNVDTADKGSDSVYEDVSANTDLTPYDTDYSKNVYALVEEFDIRIRYLGDDTTAYKLTATVDWDSSVPSDEAYKTTDTTKENAYYLHNSARVYFVVGEANNEDGITAKAIDTTNTETNKCTGYLLSSASTSSNTSGDWSDDATTLVASMTAKKNDTKKTGGDGLGNGVRVRAYFYFDGEDENCFSSAVLDNSYSIKFSFSVEKASA